MFYKTKVWDNFAIKYMYKVETSSSQLSSKIKTKTLPLPRPIYQNTSCKIVSLCSFQLATTAVTRPRNWVLFYANWLLDLHYRCNITLITGVKWLLMLFLLLYGLTPTAKKLPREDLTLQQVDGNIIQPLDIAEEPVREELVTVADVCILWNVMHLHSTDKVESDSFFLLYCFSRLFLGRTACTVVLRKRAQYQISAHPPLLLQFPAKV